MSLRACTMAMESGEASGEAEIQNRPCADPCTNAGRSAPSTKASGEAVQSLIDPGGGALTPGSSLEASYWAVAGPRRANT